MEQENNNFNEDNKPTISNEIQANLENVDYNKEINENSESKENNKKSSNNKIIIFIIILLLIGFGIGIYYIMNNKKTNKPNIIPNNPPEEKDKNDYLAYQIMGNAIENFDLQFLKLENKNENIIYSPLSIKYALEMLKEGANGKTKEQITRIIGNYIPKNYPNNANMSFANAMFIKDSYKNFIKDTYIDALSKKFNAEIVYDPFENPNKINNWVSEKSFKLINGLLQDISDKHFILANALAIDMEWVKKIQPEELDWGVQYIHEDYTKYVSSLNEIAGGGFTSLKFQNSPNVAAVEFGAVANKYDIVNVMGENTVREIVGNAYQKWLDEGAPESCYDPEYSDESEKDPDRETFVNGYIKEINENYNQISSSTDFSFYVDDNTKIFSKDLKEYAGTTLQYIAIMPTKTELAEFIKNTNATEINDLINKIKPIKLETFKEGVITEITGFIPMFKFDYKLNLIDDLKELGITNIFTEKADLSNLTTEKAFITEALHQATIEFSNSGIKAAAVSMMGGAGGGECGFDYIFKIPADRIEKIDLTFDKPFLFLILDKNTKEIWFTGSVYNPSEYESYVKNIKFEEEY